ncbi:SHOCT domain-containing protein [Oceanobacillus sp. CFH 90083]|uniref:SHOCT domain-containing protein n=1 Tax=Oceanobacillus sp. CFH 90083 TaxID=2592336 RepID=UPI00128E032C|nr:SHOCT domain-containing protein [Oceanobacillus sp. CFH 90083]
MNSCKICGESIGVVWLEAGKLGDGNIVCNICLNKAKLGVKQRFKLKELSIDDVKKGIAGSGQKGIELLDFKANQKLGTAVHFDDTNEKLLIPASPFDPTDYNTFINYKDIKSFELLEDGETVTSGGLGRAIAGGVLFGQTGAVVGAVTGGKKSKGICTTMKMKLDLVNPDDKYNAKIRYITFIAKPTKKNSQEYLQAVEYAQQSISKLQLICDEHKQEEQQNTINETEKILEYKNLLDQGIITEEEFAIKKKELLGL